MNRDVIIAHCDFSRKKETLTFLDHFQEEKSRM